MRGPHPAIIYVHDGGKDVEAHESGIAAELARAGSMVFAMDLRGWGETRWSAQVKYTPSDVALLGTDSRLAYLGYFLGEWPLTQRVADAIRCVDQVVERSDVDVNRIAMLGHGGGGWWRSTPLPLTNESRQWRLMRRLLHIATLRAQASTPCPRAASFPVVLLHYDLPSLLAR